MMKPGGDVEVPNVSGQNRPVRVHEHPAIGFHYTLSIETRASHKELKLMFAF